MPSHKRRPDWAQELIRDVERYGPQKTYLRESKNSKLYSSYVACFYDIINVGASNYEEDEEKRVWKDAMGEEYQSIVKNDVWDVVPRPKD
jgi:hypothetical protein